MAAKEIWKPIPGHKGYEVSDQGRVRSMDREVVVDHRGRGTPWVRRYHGRMLKLIPSEGRYFVVSLGEGNRLYVHQAVMLAFVGDPPPGMETAHNNGKGTDNRLSNLRYDTPPGNAADKLAHGTHGRGERCPTARLTRQQVLAIRRSKLDRKLLAKKYGVSRSHIDNIKAGHRWGWL